MKKVVGILCASDKELQPFFQTLNLQVMEEYAMLTFYRGYLQNLEIIALCSGVCKVNAAIAAQLLIDRYHVEALINAGAAGGIAPAVQLFDIVISSQTFYHDVAEDILTEYHPWLAKSCFIGDGKLLKMAETAASDTPLTVRFGRIATGEQFLESTHRDTVFEMHAPLAADMESAAVAHVCYAFQIPFLAVRVITDTRQHDGEENFEMNCEKASETAAAFVKKMLSCMEKERR